MNFLEIVNPFGMAIAFLLALPHIIYRRRHKIDRSAYDNRAMYYLDRLARFGCLLLLSFHLGVLERGFTEPKELMLRFWLITSAVLLAVYYAMWALFMKRPGKVAARLAASVCSLIVVFSGIIQVNTLLLTFGVVLIIGELYIISKLQI